jgi:hypothetical protein
MDLMQAFLLLKSLKENLPNDFAVEKKWVDDFHSILSAVESETGADLTPFRVPPGDIYNPWLACAFFLRVVLSIETVLLLAKQTINLFNQFHQLLSILFYGGLGTQGLPNAPASHLSIFGSLGDGQRNDKPHRPENTVGRTTF